MIPRLLALWRDMARSQAVASPQEEKWLRDLWSSHLRDLNHEEERTERRWGWYAVGRDVLLALAVVGYIWWVTKH